MDRKFDRVRFLKGEMPTHTRDGHKIIKVLDSGLDVAHSMVAWIDGEIGPRHYTRLGFKVWCANPEDQILDPLDLVHSTKVVHTIGDVYEFQKDNATGKKFLLVKVGDDEIDKGPTVALFNMSTGIIWASPYVLGIPIT